jgi:hypothetical protein
MTAAFAMLKYAGITYGLKTMTLCIFTLTPPSPMVSLEVQDLRIRRVGPGSIDPESAVFQELVVPLK